MAQSVDEDDTFPFTCAQSHVFSTEKIHRWLFVAKKAAREHQTMYSSNKIVIIIIIVIITVILWTSYSDNMHRWNHSMWNSKWKTLNPFILWNILSSDKKYCFVYSLEAANVVLTKHANAYHHNIMLFCAHRYHHSHHHQPRTALIKSLTFGVALGCALRCGAKQYNASTTICPRNTLRDRT